MKLKLSLIAIGVLSTINPSTQAQQIHLEPLPINLATNFQADLELSQYWQSEKLDGIRAIWNGTNFITRKGRIIHAPKWFTAQLPSHPLEGELWAGRGNFHIVQQTVLDKTPSDSGWKKITFMLFDLPKAQGSYQQRYADLVNWVNQVNAKHIRYIEQTEIESEQALFEQLEAINKAHGEGVMLRKINAEYRAGRNDDLLKLKKHQDAEATVIGYKSGNGKYSGKMGALLVQLNSGQQFYIGSGFSDQQRAEPPQIGSTITFRYNGYTQNGIPKFARYLRERVE